MQKPVCVSESFHNKREREREREIKENDSSAYLYEHKHKEEIRKVCFFFKRILPVRLVRVT